MRVNPPAKRRTAINGGPQGPMLGPLSRTVIHEECGDKQLSVDVKETVINKAVVFQIDAVYSLDIKPEICGSFV